MWKVFPGALQSHTTSRFSPPWSRSIVIVSLSTLGAAPVWVMLTGSIVREPNGKPLYCIAQVQDVTAKKQAEDEIRRRNRELNALNAMAVIATQSFDLDEILNLTLRQVISLLGAEAGSVYLAEPENRFRRRAEWGQRVTERKRVTETHFPESFGDLVMRSRAEVLTAEYLPHLPASVTGFMKAANGGSAMWVVLWGKDDPLGLMGISRGPAREYSSNDENLLLAIGRQLSTTVEKVPRPPPRKK